MESVARLSDTNSGSVARLGFFVSIDACSICRALYVELCTRLKWLTRPGRTQVVKVQTGSDHTAILSLSCVGALYSWFIKMCPSNPSQCRRCGRLSARARHCTQAEVSTDVSGCSIAGGEVGLDVFADLGDSPSDTSSKTIVAGSAAAFAASSASTVAMIGASVSAVSEMLALASATAFSLVSMTRPPFGIWPVVVSLCRPPFSLFRPVRG